MEATATAKFMRVSPRKARLVVDLIRGKKISEARTILALANKARRRDREKVLDSAIANAGQTGVIDVGTLYVKSACVNQGPRRNGFGRRRWEGARVQAADQSHNDRGRRGA